MAAAANDEASLKDTNVAPRQIAAQMVNLAYAPLICSPVVAACDYPAGLIF